MKLCPNYIDGKCTCEGELKNRKVAGRLSIRIAPEVFAVLDSVREGSGVSLSNIVSQAIAAFPESGELDVVKRVSHSITICVYLTAEAQHRISNLADKHRLQKATVAKSIVTSSFQF